MSMIIVQKHGQQIRIPPCTYILKRAQTDAQIGSGARELRSGDESVAAGMLREASLIYVNEKKLMTHASVWGSGVGKV